MGDSSASSIYEKVLARLAAGGGSAVFIDDSGLNAKPYAPSPLDSERKTWAAVFVPQDRIQDAFEALSHFTKTLARQFGLKEFHAADIYSGKGVLRTISIDLRLGIFEAMADLIYDFQLPILVQSFDAAKVRSWVAGGRVPAKVGPFDISSPSQAALVLL